MFASARIPGIALIALVLCAAPAEAARTYKWVDEDGVTHYSQYPPPEGEAQIIEPSIGVPSGTTAGDSSPPSAESAEGNEGGDGNEDSRTMQAYCKQIREQAQLLASERNVSVRKEDGTLESLEGDARARQRAELQVQIDKHCS